MGYYTWYAMNARNIKTKEEYESLIQTLKDKGIYETENTSGVFCASTYYEESNEAIFDTTDECKWYEHTYDMMNISKLFPDVIFRLRGDGEEREDMWYEYYHNGKVEECPATITFPMPVEIEWNER